MGSCRDLNHELAESRLCFRTMNLAVLGGQIGEKELKVPVFTQTFKGKLSHNDSSLSASLITMIN